MNTSKKEFLTASLEPISFETSLKHKSPPTDSPPGEFPFTRGVHQEMYREKHWTMRQYAGFGSAEESNRRYKYLLAQGQSGLSVAFDLPTQIGYDSDHPKAHGEVGKVGVAIDSLEDMEALFADIPLDKVSTSMTINAPAMVLLAMYIVAAEKKGIPSSVLRGTIQNDILKEYVARGTYIYPPVPSLRLITDTISYCKTHLPKWNTISISGYHIREAGCTAAQEIAYTVANGITYVDCALKAGLVVDEFAPQLSFFFNGFTDLFEEIAKFRAARKLWAKIMRERFQAKEDRSCMLRFHTQTAGSTLTAQDPDNNIVRVAIQALAAALGGTQSLHTNSKDEALGLPTTESATLALRTQQIIAHESGITNYVDPLAGSYVVENLTQDLLEKAEKLIAEIDSMGGMVKAIEAGFVQSQIQNSAFAYQMAIENNVKVIVGMNAFQNESSTHSPPIMQVSSAAQEQQSARLKSLRAKRGSVQKHLESLKKVAENKETNLFPHVLDAVRAYCTVGEICDVLRGVFGEFKEKIIL